MAIYLISCDLRTNRNYDALKRLFVRWKSVPLAKTAWLAELVGPASSIHDTVTEHVDRDDGVVVLELAYGSQWAVHLTQEAARGWLAAKIGP